MEVNRVMPDYYFSCEFCKVNHSRCAGSVTSVYEQKLSWFHAVGVSLQPQVLHTQLGLRVCFGGAPCPARTLERCLWETTPHFVLTLLEMMIFDSISVR